MMPFVPIEFLITACNCPLCGAYSNQEWSTGYKYHLQENKPIGTLPNLAFSMCFHCKEHCVWLKKQMIYPISGSAPLPNLDMPIDVIEDYREARNIVELSPRGAVALLRLIVQKLCIHLGQKGENINSDIANLVKEGLPEKMQKALDSVRVIGNNAVHPGKIDLKDDKETAYKLFHFVNIIVDLLITQPKQLDEFYNFKIPETSRDAIKDRDKIR
ncbi:MAG: DUF4145 domain-containing protein [Sphingobacterium sp.]|jgi:hypothetical protein|nr:DUF4145 domain-containing protein [Sphingobacterium sp.]